MPRKRRKDDEYEEAISENETEYEQFSSKFEDCVETAERSLGFSRTHGKAWQECAKELNPVFVSHLISLANINDSDTFWDLGSGIGNVVLQVAHQTGSLCVGVELQTTNHQLAEKISTLWKAQSREQPRLHLELLHGDMIAVAEEKLDMRRFRPRKPDGKIVILYNNYLMGAKFNNTMCDLFIRKLPAGSVIVTTQQLFPHTRPSTRPGLWSTKARGQFDIVEEEYPGDYVEWGAAGTVWIYTRKVEVHRARQKCPPEGIVTRAMARKRAQEVSDAPTNKAPRWD
eukprot:TRINITY_DN77217_c0_g1_i1.p1 TRINITY_DN77217_c0_g1~~TRINITY_DN77217_c0_g1_i1.p1  ORF type:complete len:285 (+),score=35.95 TRINITY_DN77217_c0_g1_i1:42-896(+)